MIVPMIQASVTPKPRGKPPFTRYVSQEEIRRESPEMTRRTDREVIPEDETESQG